MPSETTIEKTVKKIQKLIDTHSEWINGFAGVLRAEVQSNEQEAGVRVVCNQQLIPKIEQRIREKLPCLVVFEVENHGET